jgi:uncharacterized protein YecE (DUF72 family)
MLAAYAARLSSVEANVFFYGLPHPGAVAALARPNARRFVVLP